VAFLPQDEDEQKKEAGMNVLAGASEPQLGAVPGQEQAAPQEGQDVALSGGSSTIGANQPQQPQSTGTQKQGSGQFTDIRKYISANKPQAGRLAQAATGSLQKKAGQIGQGIQQKQSAFQHQLGQQQRGLEQAKKFTKQSLELANKGQEVDNIERFKQLATGAQKFGDVGELNLAQQQQKARALSNIAGQAERATGASRMLQEAFGGRQYTGGQRALDALILGGDKGARESVVTGAQGISGGIQDQLRQARMSALAGATEQGEQDIAFREQLGRQLSGARESASADIQAQTEKAKQDLIAEQKAFQDKLQSGTLTEEDITRYTNKEQLAAAVEDFNQRRGDLQSRLQTDDPTALAEFMGSMPGGQFGSQGVEISSQSALLNKQIEEMRRMGISEEDISNNVRQTVIGDIEAAQRQAEASNRAGDVTQLMRAFGATEGLSAKDLERVRGLGADELIGRFTGSYAPVPGVMGPVGGVGNLTEFSRRLGALSPLAQQIEAPTEQSYIKQFADLARQRGGGEDLAGLFSAIDPESITSGAAASDAALARQNALAALAGQVGTGVQREGSLPELAGSFDLLSGLKQLRGY
jgi:hypothetical protein